MPRARSKSMRKNAPELGKGDYEWSNTAEDDLTSEAMDAYGLGDALDDAQSSLGTEGELIAMGAEAHCIGTHCGYPRKPDSERSDQGGQHKPTTSHSSAEASQSSKSVEASKSSKTVEASLPKAKAAKNGDMSVEELQQALLSVGIIEETFEGEAVDKGAYFSDLFSHLDGECRDSSPSVGMPFGGMPFGGMPFWGLPFSGLPFSGMACEAH